MKPKHAGRKKSPVAASKPAKLVVGGLYAVPEDDGSWRVIKVLAMDRSTVHVRLYTNRYRTRPKTVDPAALTLAMTVEDLESEVLALGVGCMPIARRAFTKEQKYFLRQDSVTEEEMEDLDI